MIKNISTSSQYLYVEGGNPISTYISGHPGGLNVGQVRFNNSSQNIEIYDGNGWITFNTSYATIKLSPLGEGLLSWLENFKTEYEKEKELREKIPALKNAWERYQVVKILATKESKDG
jgi:hypothetical protein